MYGILWLIIWACVPGVGVSCKWLDYPLAEVEVMEINGVAFVNRESCLIPHMGPVGALAYEGKLVAEQTSCIFMFAGERPGKNEHKLRRPTERN